MSRDEPITTVMGWERPARPLSDGVVTLREWRGTDVPAIVELCDDPEVARFTRVPSPYTEQHAREFVAGGAIEEMSFAIVSADDDNDVLGSIGLRDAGEGRGEIGYLVAARARGRGVAARAMRLLAVWALRDAGLARVQALTHVDNPASQRAAERAGFRREGVLRGYMLLQGQRHDAVSFGLVADDLD